MEQQTPEPELRERTAVSRNQNVVHVLSPDRPSLATVLDPLLGRLDLGTPELQLLVVAPDAEMTVLAGEIAAHRTDAAPALLPVGAVPRAARLLRTRPMPAVAGTAGALVALLRGSVLKPETVRTVVLAWPELAAEPDAAESLETLMSEMPRDAARIIVAGTMSPSVEGLAERHARRARRLAAVERTEPAIDVRYVAVAPQSRPTALRRLLDDVDPDSAAVFIRTDRVRGEVEQVRRTLGFAPESPALVITGGAPVPDAGLVVLYELPASPAELQALAPLNGLLVALVTPRQVTALRTLSGGRVEAYTLSGPAERARTAEDRLRAELRAVLASGPPIGALRALEPLLDEYDGAELAAAALRLLEHEREVARDTPAAATAAPASRGAPVRLFINAGERDHIAPRDLVGAIANEASVPGDRIGRIEIREQHATVEVAAADAERIIAALDGKMLRGRRLMARPDRERPPRGPGGGAERRPRDGGQRRPPSRDRRPPSDRPTGRDTRGERARGPSATGRRGAPPSSGPRPRSRPRPD